MAELELGSLKKPGTVERISKDEFEKRIMQIAQSKRDIVWWAERFFRIVSLNTGLGVIKLYEKQKDMLRHIVANDRNIILSSRQTGKTTSYTIFCMWLATLFPEKKIMICANKLQTAIEIMDRLRIAYEYLPAWIKPSILVYNKSEITFSNQSTIRAFATSSSASRGFSCQICIIDEMAFIPKNVINEFFASVMPVVSSAKNSKVIVVSTPNGADYNNLYYSIWQQANSRDSLKNKEGWKPFRIDWFEVPGRTPQWKEKQIASIGARRFAQEFGNEFLSNTQTKKLIDDDVIEKYRMRLSEYKAKGIQSKTQRIVSENQNRLHEFQVWHAFDAKRTYMASADIAEGVGGDASVLYVWDITDMRNMRMCAKFSSNKVSLTEFAYVCSKILALYGNPWLFAERNGLSAGMLDALRITYGYENIARESKNGEPGVYSHVSVKLKACLWAREMLTTEGFGFTIYDKELVDEMSTFVKKDGKSDKTMYAAINPAHDDHVMTFIWACWGVHSEIVNKYFIVAQHFRTEFEQFYPQTVLPLESYTPETLRKIKADPLYAEFLEFQEEAITKNKALADRFKTEDEADVFKYAADPYFGGQGEPEWGSSWSAEPIQQGDSGFQNPNNRMPAYFI